MKVALCTESHGLVIHQAELEMVNHVMNYENPETNEPFTESEVVLLLLDSAVFVETTADVTVSTAIIRRLNDVNLKDGHILPAGTQMARADADALGASYTQLPYEIIDDSDIPTDRTFRNAWEHDTSSSAPEKVKTNMGKAKVIAHGVRRAARAEAFASLDIEATMPAQAVAAEAARQNIRNADAIKQQNIEDAIDESTLKELL